MKDTFINNLPSILSSVVAIITIICSTFTQYKKDKQINKLKALELKLQHSEKEITYKRATFEEYLHQANKAIYSKLVDNDCFKKYLDAYAIAFIYASPKLREEMKKADVSVKNKNIDEFLLHLDRLVNLFETESSSMYK